MQDKCVPNYIHPQTPLNDPKMGLIRCLSLFFITKTRLYTHFQQLKQFLRRIIPISIMTLKGEIFTKNATFTLLFFCYGVVFTNPNDTPTDTPTDTPSPFFERNGQILILFFYPYFCPIFTLSSISIYRILKYPLNTVQTPIIVNHIHPTQQRHTTLQIPLFIVV